MTEAAPAKVNLILQVGPRRADGLHELCSLFASLELADRVTLESAAYDELVCPGVEGPNLAQAALAALRGAGVPLPPLRVTIDKRIPVAAGLGGGSADAAAVLRAGNALAGAPLTAPELRALGARLGADVPSQVEPRHALVTGAGEHVEPVALPPMALVLLAAAEGLSTRAVYERADAIGSVRARLEPPTIRAAATGSLAALASALVNDLEPAAESLRPELAARRSALLAAGALAARVTGSGPTVFGVFADRPAAERAAAALPGAIVTGLRA